MNTNFIYTVLKHFNPKYVRVLSKCMVLIQVWKICHGKYDHKLNGNFLKYEIHEYGVY
jgi:hypothetical protein